MFLLNKKPASLSWEEVTLPLRRAKKKIKEKDVVALVHKLRRNSKFLIQIV